MYFALENEYFDLAKNLLERKSKVNIKSNDTVSLLHLAAKSDNKEIVNLLLDKKARVNARTANGETPLHWAAKYGSNKVITSLLDKDIDINIKDRGGKTPLHLAVENGNLETVQTLIESGANVDAKTENGIDPLHLLITKKHLDVEKDLNIARELIKRSKVYNNENLPSPVFKSSKYKNFLALLKASIQENAIVMEVPTDVTIEDVGDASEYNPDININIDRPSDRNEFGIRDAHNTTDDFNIESSSDEHIPQESSDNVEDNSQLQLNITTDGLGDFFDDEESDSKVQPAIHDDADRSSDINEFDIGDVEGNLNSNDIQQESSESSDIVIDRGTYKKF